MFPALEEVAVSVFIYQNAHGPGEADGFEPGGSFPTEKGMLSFPELRQTGEKFWVRLSNAVRWVEAPLLYETGDLIKITGNEVLESVDLSTLVRPHSLWVSFNASLSSFALPEAKSIEYSVTLLQTGLSELLLPKVEMFGELRMLGNEQLSALRLPLLEEVDGDFSISGNTALTELDLPSLTSIEGNLQIIENPELLDVEVAQLLEQLGEDNVGGEIDIGDNGGS